jgi:hypothetical protein
MFYELFDSLLQHWFITNRYSALSDNVSVKGFNRVPKPAANIIAFILLIVELLS